MSQSADTATISSEGAIKTEETADLTQNTANSFLVQGSISSVSRHGTAERLGASHGWRSYGRAGHGRTGGVRQGRERELRVGRLATEQRPRSPAAARWRAAVRVDPAAVARAVVGGFGGGPGGGGPGGGGGPVVAGRAANPAAARAVAAPAGAASGRTPVAGQAQRHGFRQRPQRCSQHVHVGANFSLDNSALDARSFSVTGANLDKPAYAGGRGGIMFGGPLRIPKLVSADKRILFTFNYEFQRNRTGTTSNPVNMPTALERSGDFSQTNAAGRPGGDLRSGHGAPFPGNRIPTSRISATASALLKLLSLPESALCHAQLPDRPERPE